MRTPLPGLRLMALALPLALCIAGLSVDTAQAASKKKDGARKNAATTPHKSGAVKIQRQQNHSGETRAERERRLYRECRGLPNAGACRGYTQK